MAKVRQLAHLYLRGALANETMKHLTPEQKELAELVCDQVVGHEALNGHKNMFMNKLGTTIRCDYTDRLMAQQEYRITIWRGVIYLLYHHEYSFRCTACGATSYLSQRGATIKFDRRWACCPACRQYAIDSPGDSGLERGSFILDTDYETILLSMTEDGTESPTICSCVEPIQGKKKVEKPEKILNDPDQIKKFFGEFIWNYFRQNIKENKITHHGRHLKKFCGPVDTVAVQCITQLLKVSKVNFQCDPFSPVDGYFAIYCRPYGLAPELVIDLLELKEIVEAKGGEIRIDGSEANSYLDNAILVKDLYGSAPVIELDIAINDQVQVITNGTSKNDDDESDVVAQLEKPNMNHDIREFEQKEAIAVLRKSLPEGDHRNILDLITNHGVIFEQFSKMYPDDTMANRGVPRQNRMAEFLGISQKQVKTCREAIQVQAVVHGITG